MLFIKNTISVNFISNNYILNCVMCIIGFTGQLDNKKKSDFSWANIWATAYLEKKMCDEGKKKE